MSCFLQLIFFRMCYVAFLALLKQYHCLKTVNCLVSLSLYTFTVTSGVSHFRLVQKGYFWRYFFFAKFNLKNQARFCVFEAQCLIDFVLLLLFLVIHISLHLSTHCLTCHIVYYRCFNLCFNENYLLTLHSSCTSSRINQLPKWLFPWELVAMGPTAKVLIAMGTWLLWCKPPVSCSYILFRDMLFCEFFLTATRYKFTWRAFRSATLDDRILLLVYSNQLTAASFLICPFVLSASRNFYCLLLQSF